MLAAVCDSPRNAVALTGTDDCVVRHPALVRLPADGSAVRVANDWEGGLWESYAAVVKLGDRVLAAHVGGVIYAIESFSSSHPTFRPVARFPGHFVAHRRTDDGIVFIARERVFEQRGHPAFHSGPDPTRSVALLVRGDGSVERLEGLRATHSRSRDWTRP